MHTTFPSVPIWIMPVDVITVPRSIAGEQNGHYPLNGVFGLPDVTICPILRLAANRPDFISADITKF